MESKFKLNYKYILGVCDSIAKTYNQEVNFISFDELSIYIQFKNQIELVMPKNELKTIITDSAMSDLALDSLVLGEFKLDEKGNICIESISYD